MDKRAGEFSFKPVVVRVGFWVSFCFWVAGGKGRGGDTGLGNWSSVLFVPVGLDTTVGRIVVGIWIGGGGAFVFGFCEADDADGCDLACDSDFDSA